MFQRRKGYLFLRLCRQPMPPRKDTKGKAPDQGPSGPVRSPPDQGPSGPIRSPPAVDTGDAISYNQDLQGQINALTVKFDRLLTRLSQEPLSTPTPSPLLVQNNDDNEDLLDPQPTISLTKLPSIPTIAKLKGRENYKIWVDEIQTTAEIYGIWDIIRTPESIAVSNAISNKQQQAFARSLLFTNTVPSIQSSLTAYRTA
jgi:hypothetical protein